MNQDQITSALRQILALGTTYAIAKGWISNDQAIQLTAALIPLALFAWSFWAKRSSATIAKVAAMDDVKQVVMKTAEAAAAQPSTKVVSQ